MKFEILTLFPQMFEPIINESIIGRAIKNNIIEVNITNIRDFSTDKHRRVDDYPYGGGNGMVMQPQPIYDAYINVINSYENKPKLIYMTPSGKLFNQEIATELSNEDNLIILCGHYEGIDQRVIDEIVDEEISIGDYVLTGGEIPAMVLIDAVSRLVPRVLGNDESSEEESFSNGLLEYPQYTRPVEWNERTVPEVLVSGHHANIKKWQHEEAIKRTKKVRPDLLK